MPDDLPPMITGKQLELLRKAVEIEQTDAKAVGMVGYQARLWAQVALPYRNPGDVPHWERRNGRLRLSLTPGLVELPNREFVRLYPFGTMPRLLLTWMSTEAVRISDRELALGPSLSAFMRQLGLSRDGRTISRLRTQVQSLAYCNMQVIEQRDDVTHSAGFQVASAMSLWWTPTDRDTDALWPSTLTLTDEFYRSIKSGPVPVDLRALAALRTHGGGGLPIDVYTWLAHRMSYLRTSTLVPWSLLAQQFGSQYERLRDFKAELLRALPKVLTVYPNAKVTPTTDGLLLSPSPTPIASR